VDHVAELERLFRAEYTRLVRSLAVAFGDADAAADAVQDAFVQASRHWSRIAGYADPAAWVRRAAINRLSNRRRGQRRRDAAVRRLGDQAAELAPVPDVDLVRALSALAPQRRTAVCLYYLADLPIRDVATAMGIAEGTVKAHLFAARAALAKAVEVHDG
jgi:RNA polymerase sigma-70 factor (ECF subfamily)